MNIDRFAHSRPRLVLALILVAASLLVGPAAASASDRPAERSAASDPVASSTNRGTGNLSAVCGGRLAFGEIFVCPTITGEERHVYSVVTRQDADQLFIQRTRGSGDWPSGQVIDQDGQSVCAVGVDASTCQVGPAGRYRIVLEFSFGGSGDYSLAVESMRTPSSCVPLPNSFFSFASPGYPGTLPAGATAKCFRFDQPVGSLLHLADPAADADVQAPILDAQFQPVCRVRYTHQCPLATPGPYHVFLYEHYGAETAYTLKMHRISNSAGCPVQRLAPFGDPGDAAGTGTVTTYEQVTCHKLKPAVGGIVAVRISPIQDLWWTIYDNAGQRLCDKFANDLGCALPAAGSYTLLIQNQSFFGQTVEYTVAVAALFRNGGCATATGTTWDLPTLLVHQTSPVQTNCQPFRGNAGDRIIHYRAPTVFNDVRSWLVDSTGAELCTAASEEDGCVLPATGTYRVVSFLVNWEDGTEDATYKLQVRRLSNPVGCPEVSPGAYGAPPAGALGGIRCRILEIPAAGVYFNKAVDAQNSDYFGQIYDAGGLRTDACGTIACTFASPGRYTMVLGGSGISSVVDNDFQYAVTLLSAAPSGCPSISDTGYLDAPYRGSFAIAGQYDCLQLPSPAGSRVVEFLPGDATAAGRPFTVVVDANGEYLCDTTWALRQASCELVGTAPFYAVLNANEGIASASYAVSFGRVDGPPACPVLPRTADGATVTTGGDRFAVCFSVPADEHAAVESFTYRRLTGAGNASMSVYDGTGLRYCGPTSRSSNRTFSCSLPAGPATVILETDAVDATYQLSHRDPSVPTG